jgi:uncharacterized phage-like protein YoqJ
MFAQHVVALREECRDRRVKLTAVIPCLEHDKSWASDDRILCRKLIRDADDVILVSNSRYYDGCMAKRNRCLVDSCDELLAIYDGQRGGTMQTINFAKGAGMKITVIDPAKELIIILRKDAQIEKSFKKL